MVANHGYSIQRVLPFDNQCYGVKGRVHTFHKDISAKATNLYSDYTFTSEYLAKLVLKLTDL